MRTTASIIFLTAAFLGLNNLSQIPWEIMQYLWYGYIPCLSGTIAFGVGSTAKQSGKGILIAAVLLVPALLLSAKYALPFASTFTAIPSLVPAALVPIPAEIAARRHQNKKQRSPHSAASHPNL